MTIPRSTVRMHLILVPLLLVLALAPSGTAAANGTGPRSPGPAATAVFLSRMGISPSGLSLQWTQSVDICFQSYTLEYSTASSTGPWNVLGTIYGNTSTTEYIYRLQPSRTYWWSVVDTDCGGATAPSNTLALTQPAVATLVGTLVSPTSVSFAWTNPATYGGLLSFQSYQILGTNGGSWIPVGSLISDVTTRSDVVTNLAPDTNWSFRLVTTDQCNACFGGTYSTTSSSNTVLATTPAPLQATLQASPASVDWFQTTRFVCTATGGVTPFNYTWDFGDGRTATSTSGIMDHAYGFPGSFAATCSVTDRFGEQAAATATATVTVWWVVGVVGAAVGTVAVALLLRRRRQRPVPPPAPVPPAAASPPTPAQAPEYPSLPPPPGSPPGGP